MLQRTFAEVEYEGKKRQTRREKFLGRMEALIPWHLLEKHELGAELLAEINRHLAAQGLRLQKGTIVEASIMDAPSSLKNRQRERDGEMKQTRKGRQWHFGMKAHIGVDAATGLVHSVAAPGANVADMTQVGLLLHGGEEQVHGDAGYQGVEKRPEHRERVLD